MSPRLRRPHFSFASDEHPQNSHPLTPSEKQPPDADDDEAGAQNQQQLGQFDHIHIFYRLSGRIRKSGDACRDDIAEPHRDDEGDEAHCPVAVSDFFVNIEPWGQKFEKPVCHDEEEKTEPAPRKHLRQG